MEEPERLYSLAYVTADKVEGSRFIEAYPITTVSTANGDLSVSEEIVTDAIDDDGKATSVVINKSNKITSEWYNDGSSNSLEAPMVTKGEIVKLYVLNEQDKFWWKTMFTKPEYRKREKSLFFFSNKGEIMDASEDVMSKGYFALVDTINKKIHLHTADNDGELCTYDISLDTKKGSLLIIDGKKNLIELASHKDELIATTNSKITLNTKTATVNATDKTEVNTDYCIINSKLCDINP